ncbi:MAG: sulfotransferase family 2 domain-containing protein [Paracoccaceae bacterium]|nr:sulfotransferase family 2 domain-containing protein [Paracoccaceae bacterium]
MLVFWDQKLVFLATPKTGSTAIEAALESLAEVAILRPPVMKHTTSMRYRKYLQPFLERNSGQPFTAVALMREPIDWLGSWYRFRQREAIRDTNKSTYGMSFDDFVTSYMAKPRPEFADVGSQATFLMGKNGNGVDRIFLYEDISAFVAFLEDRLGCEIVLPRVNVSPPGETTLSPKVRALYERTYPEEFELYERVRAAT